MARLRPQNKWAILSFCLASHDFHDIGLRYLYTKIELRGTLRGNEVLEPLETLHGLLTAGRKSDCLRYVRDLTLVPFCEEWSPELLELLKEAQLTRLFVSYASTRFLEGLWPLVGAASKLRLLHVHSIRDDDHVIPGHFRWPESLTTFNMWFIIDGPSSTLHFWTRPRRLRR